MMTQNQVPDKSILDRFDRQTYLGNAFIVPVEVDLSDTSEVPCLMITNPVVTSVAAPTAQKAIFLNLRRVSSSAQQAVIKTYVNPTVTSTGTTSTPTNLRPASSNVSIAKFYAAGEFAVSANGTLVSALGIATDSISVTDNTLLIILDPGQTVMVTATALDDGTTIDLDFSWYEL